jgi:putative membrane protein
MMNGWGWYWGALMMVLFWGGLAVAVVIAVRTFGNSHRDADQATDAKAILEARFARGEISREEFEDRRKALDPRAA